MACQGRLDAVDPARAVPRNQGGGAGLLWRGALRVHLHSRHGVHAGYDYAGPRVDCVQRDHDGERAQAA